LGRDRIHQPQACVSQTLQRNHNSIAFLILKVIRLYFQDLANAVMGNWFVWKIMHKSIPQGGDTMPAPLPDLTRDQQCHFYMAPTGQRCGSPALKGDYYCYHHHLKNAKRTQQRVLIDPEVTRMELPPIEDRASLFVALVAVVHRLAENTIDTRRAGQMIYALQVALQSLTPAQPQHTAQAQHSPHAATASHSAASDEHDAAIQPATQPDGAPSAAPGTFSIRKQDLLYFLRSRHCATCNAELFPASELTERSHPGAPPEIIEEARPALAAPTPTPDTPPEHLPADTSGPDESETVLTLQAVAEKPQQSLPPRRRHSERRRAAPQLRISVFVLSYQLKALKLIARESRLSRFTAASDTPSPHRAPETAAPLP